MKKIIFMLMLFTVFPVFAQLPSFLSLRVGAKGAVTGNLYMKPDETPHYSGLPWDNTQFYIGEGGGIFFEANFIKFISLRTELLYEKNCFKEKTTVNNYYEYNHFVHFTQLLIPVLLKAVLPTGIVELSIGTGPVFTIGLDSSTDYETLNFTPAATMKTNWKSSYHTKSVNDIYWATNIGIEFKVWKLIIPFEIRGSYNISQPKKYKDRVKSNNINYPFTIRASDTWHFTVSLGVGYVF